MIEAVGPIAAGPNLATPTREGGGTYGATAEGARRSLHTRSELECGFTKVRLASYGHDPIFETQVQMTGSFNFAYILRCCRDNLSGLCFMLKK